jgi:uncharacterized protein (TIGR02328 family)
MRGKGWGRKHSVVDYVWKHNYLTLFFYHTYVMAEAIKRGVKIDDVWKDPLYRGKVLGSVEVKTLPNVEQRHYYLYPEHDQDYFMECVALLRAKQDKDKYVEI